VHVTVLVTGRSDSLRNFVKNALRASARVVECQTYAAAERALKECEPAVLVVAEQPGDDVTMVAFAHTVKVGRPWLEVILIGADRSERFLVGALRARVSDCLKLPAASEDIADAVRACLERRTGGSPDPSSRESSELREKLVGAGPAAETLRERLFRVARSECNVLITGETGTGKELAADLIHSQSTRRGKPLVCVNCAAVPDLLFESELFGYERGAFTGANSTKDGKIRHADGGSVLLDEIGDMSSYAQAKILRLLESKEVQRLGGRGVTIVDVRFIAATNHELEELVEKGSFRRDLYYRLNVARLHLPALRERREDIPMLAGHFSRIFGQRCGHRIQGFSKQALDLMTGYDWPGNIRELRNVVESVFVNRPYPFVEVDDLPQSLLGAGIRSGGEPDAEKLMRVLRITNWNKSETAKRLNWSRMTLYRKMAKYGIHAEDGNESAAVLSATAS
jgi:DNA-binding NtrC family response regulator